MVKPCAYSDIYYTTVAYINDKEIELNLGQILYFRSYFTDYLD